MAAESNPSPSSGNRPALLDIRTTVILLVAVTGGLLIGILMWAAGHHLAEAVVAGIGAAGATVVACHGLIDSRSS